MSRKNRNARRQANKPLNAYQLSMPIPQPVSHPTTLRMLDDHCGFEFATLSSTMLETDTSYQRRIDDKRVERIVENFDPRLVNPVKVSFRDGHYYVFDGAHTLAALKQVHKFDNFMVDCMLFQGLTYEDEAYLFALQRGESKEVAMAARLKALLKSNDESAADLRRRLLYGLNIDIAHDDIRAKLRKLLRCAKPHSRTCARYHRSLASIVNRLHQSTTLSLLNVTKYEIRNEMMRTTKATPIKANPHSKPCRP